MKSMKMNKNKMVDVTFAEKSSDFPGNSISDKPEYFYGLRLCLGNDAIKALGLNKMPKVGDLMKLEAVVEVCCRSESEYQEGGINQSMDLQITEMELSGMKAESPSDKLYGENSVKVDED